MPTRYTLTLAVDDSSMGEVIQAAVAAGGKVESLVAVKDAAVGQTGAKNFSYAHGMRKKGITGKELALQLFKEAGRPVRMTEVANYFIKHKFAGNSANPVVYTLVKEKKLRALGEGLYQLYTLPLKDMSALGAATSST